MVRLRPPLLRGDKKAHCFLIRGDWLLQRKFYLYKNGGGKPPPYFRIISFIKFSRI